MKKDKVSVNEVVSGANAFLDAASTRVRCQHVAAPGVLLAAVQIAIEAGLSREEVLAGLTAAWDLAWLTRECNAEEVAARLAARDPAAIAEITLHVDKLVAFVVGALRGDHEIDRDVMVAIGSGRYLPVSEATKPVVH